MTTENVTTERIVLLELRQASANTAVRSVVTAALPRLSRPFPLLLVPGDSERPGSESPLSRPDGTEHRDCVARLSGSVVATSINVATNVPIKGETNVTPITADLSNRAAGHLTFALPPVHPTLPANRRNELIAGKEDTMSNNARLADHTVKEVMETQEETWKLDRIVNLAMADGKVTLDEARAIQRQAREVMREANEDVLAAEKTNVGEKLAIAGLTGIYSVPLLRQARRLGLKFVLPEDATILYLDDYRQEANQPA